MQGLFSLITYKSDQWQVGLAKPGKEYCPLYSSPHHHLALSYSWKTFLRLLPQAPWLLCVLLLLAV